MNNMDYFNIGKIVNTVGIKGEIKVFPTTDDPKRFAKMESIIVRDEKGKETTLTLEKVRFQKNVVIVKVEGVDDIDTAAKLRGGVIVVSREDAMPLEDGEYYIPDLLGVEVFLENGDKLGTLTDVLVTGANDVYVIKAYDGSEVLVPAIEQCIIDVDIDAKRMTARLLEGL